MRKKIQMKAPMHMTWRLEEELYNRIVDAAEQAGMSVSAYMRWVMVRELGKGSMCAN